MVSEQRRKIKRYQLISGIQFTPLEFSSTSTAGLSETKRSLEILS